jgi:bacterioferritin-associated ferredoxin
MHKIEEIVRSWASAIKSTEEDEKRASVRLQICSICEHKKEAVFGSYCGKCGCPLKAKVFTPMIPGCPEKKW